MKKLLLASLVVGFGVQAADARVVYKAVLKGCEFIDNNNNAEIKVEHYLGDESNVKLISPDKLDTSILQENMICLFRGTKRPGMML